MNPLLPPLGFVKLANPIVVEPSKFPEINSKKMALRASIEPKARDLKWKIDRKMDFRSFFKLSFFSVFFGLVHGWLLIDEHVSKKKEAGDLLSFFQILPMHTVTAKIVHWCCQNYIIFHQILCHKSLYYWMYSVSVATRQLCSGLLHESCGINVERMSLQIIVICCVSQIEIMICWGDFK